MFKEALTEMNDLIGLKNEGKPLVITEEMTESECRRIIQDAIPILNKTDFFSKETTATLKDMGWDRTKLHDEPLSIDEEIGNAETIKQLKEIALVEPQFKSIRGRLASYKTVDELREAMLWLMSPEKLSKKIEDAPVQTTVDLSELTNEELHAIQKLTDVTFEPIETKTTVTGTLTAKETPVDDEIKIEEIVIRNPFNNLFSIAEGTLDAIRRNMEKNGYDGAFPVILWGDTLIDGHTRIRAASSVGIETVPYIQKDFKDEREAVEYCIHNQRDRRNITQAELLRCIQALDKPMTKQEAGAKRSKEKMTPTHKETAKVLGIGESKVTDARTVLKDEKATQEVITGKTTIAKAASKIRKKKGRKPTIKVMNRIDTTIKVLKNNSGGEVEMVYLVEESDNLFLPFGKSNMNEQEEVVKTTLPVLVSLKLITLDGDKIQVKKSLK